MKKQKSKKNAANFILILILFLSFGFYYKKECKASDTINPQDTKGFIYYKDNIAPILAKSCSSKDEKGAYICHGKSGAEAEKEEYAKFHNAPFQNSQYCQTCHTQTKEKFSFPLDSKDKISTPAQYMLSYIQAKQRAAHNKIPFAKILRMPLVGQSGGFGLYHKGGEIFNGTSDPQYKKLAEWVRLENEDIKKVLSQNKIEQFFAKKVLPVYARNSCFNPSCHIFNHSSFLPDAGMETEDLNTKIEDRFSLEQIKFNRMTSKGLIQNNVYFTGDVEQSRILKKNIPINQGGVLHRGGNDQFFTGPADPDYKILKEWLMMERKDITSKLMTGGKKIDPAAVGRLDGILFVRTNVGNHRKYLDVGKYMPGADLYLLKLKKGETLENASGKPINLTEPFRKGKAADIREPDIRYDGKAILFAMRIGEEDNLNIYELVADSDLDFSKGKLRRLTYGPKHVNGIKIHYTDPTYVPDPADKNAANGGYNLDKADIVFSSNLSGNMIQSEERGIVGEADAGDTKTIIDFDRPEMDNTFIGKRIYIVDGTNKGEWRKITDFKNRLFTDDKRSYITVNKPFAKPIDNSTIYVIEQDKKIQPGFMPSYSVYGIKYPAPLQEKQNYDKTISRITYGIAQELDLSVRTTGEVFFAGQRSFTDKYDRPIFHMTSCRRHLDTRFSFPTHQGNRSEVIIYADNHEMPSGIDMHIGMEPRNLWEGGNVNLSDHQMGPGLEARNPHDFSTGYFDENKMPNTEYTEISNTRYGFKDKKQPSHTRFIFKKISLFPLRGPNAVSRTGYSPGGVFKDSVPLPNGDILISHSNKPIDNLNPKANPDFDLYIIKPDPSFHSQGGKTNPKVKKIKIKAASKVGTSEVQAYPLYVRLKPKINAAKRDKAEHLIGPAGKPEDNRPAIYLERNYLLIDAIMDNPAPVGKNTAYPTNPITGDEIAPIDEVKYVRMVQVMPVEPNSAKKIDPNKIKNKDPQSSLISNGIHLRKKIVCEAPLESDGSIYIKIPSKIPIAIQSLNKDKMALRQSARLYFFAPNETFTISPSKSETFQTCGACMGSMSGDPKKLFGPINKFTGQTKVKAIANANGNPKEYGIKQEQRIAIDFLKDIQPLLNKNCAACHNGDKAPAGLSLTDKKTFYYNEAYENLMRLQNPESGWYSYKKYIDERGALAIKSYLIEKVYGKELKALRKLTGDVPHPSVELIKKYDLNISPLTEKEKLTLVRWIDMGATFSGAD